MRIQQRRQEGDLFQEYVVDRNEGFQLSPAARFWMLLILGLLVLLFGVMFIKVKIDANYFNPNPEDF